MKNIKEGEKNDGLDYTINNSFTNNICRINDISSVSYVVYNLDGMG